MDSISFVVTGVQAGPSQAHQDGCSDSARRLARKPLWRESTEVR